MLHKQRFWIVVLIGLFFIDRWFKAIALSGTELRFLPGVLDFALFKNTGIAFSLPFSGPLVWVVSVAILAAISLAASKEFQAGRYDMLGAFGLFIFGACSNLFDRVLYGFTVDYLIITSRSAVNLADGMILAGVLWMISRRPKK